MTERVFDECNPVVHLLLCAAELARLGHSFALTAAVEWLDCPFADYALVAAFEAREIGRLYGEPMCAEAYLEAAYRVMEGRGVTS